MTNSSDETHIQYNFWRELRAILNSRQSRSVVLHGNTYDLFWDSVRYVPLIPYLIDKVRSVGWAVVVMELNGPLRMAPNDRVEIKEAWVKWKSQITQNEFFRSIMRGRKIKDRSEEFDYLLDEATGNSTLALELLRQMTICSRESMPKKNLLIIVEAAEMLLPAGNGDISTLNDIQQRRIAIIQDWFSDPDFCDGSDCVVMVAESAAMIQQRIMRMPQVKQVDVATPNMEQRRHYIQEFISSVDSKPKLWKDKETLAEYTAGLSTHALRQLLLRSSYEQTIINPAHVISSVEEYIQQQLGSDVVEFHKPSHKLSDCVGFSKLKQFFKKELIPRFQTSPDKALPGALIAGPIGSGKTYLMEALASELDLPVLILKNLRSQWFGQTDVIFESLRRVLKALNRVVIFVDEADSQFGKIDESGHDTERRLTGKIQAMMSDPQLRGKVFWLLMTARPHLLSPDIRRPGRVGDLIIPVLDPEGEDRVEFIKWTCGVFKNVDLNYNEISNALPEDFSAASFASLRSYLKSLPSPPKDANEIREIMSDFLAPSIGKTREYQKLQALINCTRRSLLPDREIDEEWFNRIHSYELNGEV